MKSFHGLATGSSSRETIIIILAQVSWRRPLWATGSQLAISNKPVGLLDMAGWLAGGREICHQTAEWSGAPVANHLVTFI